MSTLERALATIETVVAIDPIPDADAIEAATIRGWKIVVKKGAHAAGDRIIYVEIDSALPLADPRFADLAPRGEKTIDVHGVPTRVHVLKTARFRGQYSQGLTVAIDDLPEAANWPVGTDVTSLLGITKYEEPIPTEIQAHVSGGFPTQFAPRTGSVRVQNLTDDILATLAVADTWSPTEKVDGTSTTVINDHGVIRVAGRNWEFIVPESMDHAVPQVKLVDSLDLANTLPEGWLVQGEFYGEGAPRNPLRVKGPRLMVFSVFNGWGHRQPRSEWPLALLHLAAPTYNLAFPTTVAQALEQVEGIKSLIAPDRIAEGVVWHSASGRTFPDLDGRDTFKAISSKYLLKNGG